MLVLREDIAHFFKESLYLFTVGNIELTAKAPDISLSLPVSEEFIYLFYRCGIVVQLQYLAFCKNPVINNYTIYKREFQVPKNAAVYFCAIFLCKNAGTQEKRCFHTESNAFYCYLSIYSLNSSELLSVVPPLSK